MTDDTPDLTPFYFNGPDGKQYELPDVRVLSPRQMQTAARGDLEAMERGLLDNGADQDAIEAFMSLPFWRINQLIEQWVSGEGDPEGKPSKSSRSSSSTATRSKPTSKSAGSRSRR